MKKKGLILVMICILAVTFLAVGCNKYKQDAIPTDNLQGAEVSSNGGLAVKVGKYLYYINGYASQTGENTFGETVKGAIARVELDANGAPIMSTNVIVVPKNIYNSEKTSGLVVMGDYIYFTSPSDKKNGKGEAKTEEMFLMRAKLDGTDIKVIAEFDDYTTTYRVTPNGNVVYLNKDGELHNIDLGTKKFKDKLVAEDVTAKLFGDYDDNANAMSNTVFFTKAAANDNDSHNEVWKYTAGDDGASKVFDGKGSYNGKALEHDKGYTITLKDVQYVGEKARLIYSKSDAGSNKKSTGDYAYDFDGSFAFDWTKEVRYSMGKNYTSIYFLNNGEILTVDGSGVYFTKDATPVIEKASITVVSVEETDTAVYVYYLASNVLYKIQVLAKNAGVYTVNIGSAETYFNSSFDSSWLSIDKVDNLIVFFNSKALNNTYVLDLSKVESRNVNTLIASQLGIFSDADVIEMLEKVEGEEEK